ncbi:hypothetical protein AWZ03_013678 [Drosophila navojoa]|uniref:Uncharacterized protein n=1 Tax=Drosophila navojoa TaxID=7232 RepID=A0A484AT80_DRONA|nr:hypothetical protein AWZ03_013678 [Drosophila navojoa]
MPSGGPLSASLSARPVIVWNGAQYTASSRELELELLRRDYGLDERMLEATLVPRYKRHKPQASAKNAHVRHTRAACNTVAAASDWILRQGNSGVSQINFHPWTELGERKFSHFDLVPWRRTRSALDLSSVADYSGRGSETLHVAEKTLRGLEKLELRHNRRRLQRARSTQQGLRRQVRVRLIFSIELRHKRMELLRQTALPMRVFEQRFAISENESAAYERILLDANAGVEQHVGYFSRRSNSQPEAAPQDDEQQQLVVDFASETEAEDPEAETQYATIANAPQQQPESSEKKPADQSKVSFVAAEETAKAQPAAKVPCVKCRDIAIKLR